MTKAAFEPYIYIDRRLVFSILLIPSGMVSNLKSITMKTQCNNAFVIIKHEIQVYCSRNIPCLTFFNLVERAKIPNFENLNKLLAK